MRIVTQRNESSIEFDGTEIFLQYEHVCYQSNVSKGKLGTYESRERARDIFDEMHRQWEKDCISVFYMPKE